MRRGGWVALVVVMTATALPLGAAALPGGGGTPGDGKRSVALAATTDTAGVDGLFDQGSGTTWVRTASGDRVVIGDADAPAGGATALTVHVEPPAEHAAPIGSAIDCGRGMHAAAPVPAGGRALLALASGAEGCTVDGRPFGQPEAVLLIDMADPAAPDVVGAIPTALADVTPVASADGRVLYLAGTDTETGHGTLLVGVVVEPRKPVVTATVPLGRLTQPRSVALDDLGGRLYVSAGTHTTVLDLADRSMPVVLGRLADAMIRNHETVDVDTVWHPLFGQRTFLSIVARLGGGAGCRTGTLYVFDVTGRLADGPVRVLTSDIPADATGHRGDAPPVPGDCPQAAIDIDGAEREMNVAWATGRTSVTESPTVVRRESEPYDITTTFQGAADICRLIPA